MTWTPPSHGALDDTAWPVRLRGRAVACEEGDDRLFGYAVLEDVARNYRFSDLVYLGITGQLPDPVSSQRFAVALCAAAPVSVAEASSHAGVLARLSGSTFGSALATGLLIATDRARHVVASHGGLLAWLAAPVDRPPMESADDRAWIANLAAAAELELPAVGRQGALLALFYAAGLRQPEHFEAAIVAAQVATLSAEALQTGPHHLGEYPVKTPEFRYVEGRDSDSDAAGITMVRRK
jgi:hypothetical protein